MKDTQVVRALAVINSLAFVATIVVNALANGLPINGKTTGQLSDQYENLFVPAGLTFSIWGLIYIMMCGFVIYQLRCAFGASQKCVGWVRAIGGWFFLSSCANVCWILAWHYERVALSLVLMVVLLVSLIRTYLNLGPGRSSATRLEKATVLTTFSVYLGWITVATIANTTALLVDLEWGRWGMSEPFWTVVVIAVAIVLTLIVLKKHGDLSYGLVVAWALLGILFKRATAQGPVHLEILVVVVVGLCLIGVSVITLLLRKRVQG